MPGEVFPTVFNRYITICFTSTENTYEQHSTVLPVDFGFWEPHLDTDHDKEEI